MVTCYRPEAPVLGKQCRVQNAWLKLPRALVDEANPIHCKVRRLPQRIEETAYCDCMGFWFIRSKYRVTPCVEQFPRIFATIVQRSKRLARVQF